MQFQTEGIFAPAVFENPRRRRRRQYPRVYLPFQGNYEPQVQVQLPYYLVPQGRQGTFSAAWSFTPQEAAALKLGKPVYEKNGIKYYGVTAKFKNGLTSFEAINHFRHGLQKIKGQTPWVKIVDFKGVKVGNRHFYMFIVNA